MGELLRFRLARAVQKRVYDDTARVFIERNPTVAHKDYNDTDFDSALQHLLQDPDSAMERYVDDTITVLGKPAQLTTPIGQLDRWLTSQANRPTPKELHDKLHEYNSALEKVLVPQRPDLSSKRQTMLSEPSSPTLLTDEVRTEETSYSLEATAKRFLELQGINWWVDRRNIGFSLLRALIYNTDPAVAMYLNRLMLVLGLIELAADHGTRLRDAHAIYWAIRWRTVILPQHFLDYFLNRSPRSLVVRRPGFSDLYIVRDEWVSYEAGEIAHVQNVMAGESHERLHTRLTENEEVVMVDQQRNTLDERDTQSTDRFDLHDETSRDTSMNVGFDAQVETSGQYGPTKVDTHFGLGLEFSLNESQAQATTTAHEIVARAVVRVEEKVRTVRTTRSFTRFEEKNRHSFENTAADAQHIVGIYRWVNKIKRVQIFRYPNRFLLEFQIPEPGAWLRWLLKNANQEATIAENPVALTLTWTPPFVAPVTIPLTPQLITKDNYLGIAARYKTLGIQPPPVAQVISINLTKESNEAPVLKQFVHFNNVSTLTVPPGYKATVWAATTQFTAGLFLISGGPTISTIGSANIWVAVGSGVSIPALNDAAGAADREGKTVVGNKTEKAFATTVNGVAGNVNFGAIPVSVMSNGVSGFNVNVNVTCEPLPEKLVQWQIDTYEMIAQAYYAMKRQYDEELASREVRAGIQINGQSPVRNAEMAREEIKKLVIELLTAADFKGRNAISRTDVDGKPLAPEIMLQEAVRIAPEIQFLEQAFEWENMTYVLYPYFWAAQEQWPQLADLNSEDPDFARFLRAGSARVVLSARPGFEIPAILYTYLGILWGGDPAPGPGDDDYLSMADEIRAQQQPPRDGEAGESWDVTLPTTLVWLDNLNSSMPVKNPKAKFDPPPGKVLP